MQIDIDFGKHHVFVFGGTTGINFGIAAAFARRDARVRTVRRADLRLCIHWGRETTWSPSLAQPGRRCKETLQAERCGETVAESPAIRCECA